MLEAKRRDIAERPLDLLAHLGLLVGVNALKIGRERGPGGGGLVARFDTENPIELSGPVDLVFGQAPLPAAEVRDALSVRHEIRNRPELLARAVCDVGAVLPPSSVVGGWKPEQALAWPHSPS